MFYVFISFKMMPLFYYIYCLKFKLVIPFVRSERQSRGKLMTSLSSKIIMLVLIHFSISPKILSPRKQSAFFISSTKSNQTPSFKSNGVNKKGRKLERSSNKKTQNSYHLIYLTLSSHFQYINTFSTTIPVMLLLLRYLRFLKLLQFLRMMVDYTMSLCNIASKNREKQCNYDQNPCLNVKK